MQSTAENMPEEETTAQQSHRSTTRRIMTYILKRRRTKIFFIVGLLRSGKSSLFESLTGKKGHSGDGIDSVTREYQLGQAKIDGQYYIFVDTPGFDDPRTTNEAVFRNIASLVQEVRDAVVFAGILYVHEVKSVYSAGNSLFIDWLLAFCGSEFSSYVTFVTTKWDDLSPRAQRKEVERLEEWKGKWSVFLEHGAGIYNHGKQYDEDGVETDTVLDIEEDEEERKTQAKMMIVRHYGKEMMIVRHDEKESYTVPLFVRELKQGKAIEDTAAARVLGLQPENPAADGSTAGQSQDGPNWFELLTNMLLWPFRALFNLVRHILELLPAVTWRYRWITRGFEIILTMPLATQIAVGWGRHGIYVDIPPVEDDEDSSLENFDAASDWEADEDPLAGLGDNPEEQQFADAFQRALERMRNGGSGGICKVM